MNRNQRAAHLEQLRDEQRTMIFYEAPHKLCRTLADMAAVFGGDRSLSLCRELTKIHEEVQLTTFAQAIAYYENTPPAGKYVLVVAGAVPQKAESVTLEDICEPYLMQIGFLVRTPRADASPRWRMTIWVWQDPWGTRSRCALSSWSCNRKENVVLLFK